MFGRIKGCWAEANEVGLVVHEHDCLQWQLGNGLEDSDKVVGYVTAAGQVGFVDVVICYQANKDSVGLFLGCVDNVGVGVAVA